MISESTSNLTFKKILIFWLPLVGTWLMMAIEGPYLSAIIARMSEPKINLAAYGVAFSFALLIEAPIIMMLSASTALVDDIEKYKKLRNFTYFLNAALTFIMIIFLIPQVFYFIAMDLINLPLRVAELTHIATFLMLPWPAAIGYRRFHQGVLIKMNYTRRVAYGTVIRLVTMSLLAITLYLLSSLDGVIVGALSLTTGVIAEALAVKIMSVEAIKKLKGSSSNHENRSELSYKNILSFYYPLALTSILALGVHPIVTFFMGQSRFPLESLAVLPVINALVFIFRSIGLSYQEVGIALIGRNMKNYRVLKNFTILGGLLVMLLLGIIAFTPLSNIWFVQISGLSLSLAAFADLPLKIIWIIPGLSFLLSFQRSVLVFVKRTRYITVATAIEVCSIIIVLIIAVKYLLLIGAVAAMIALVIGRLSANIYLFASFKNSIKKYQSDE
ncbi:hypothetical protein ACFLS9_02560 [Bacteroidota bacterium]